MLTKNEIKTIRLLREKKHREEQGCFVAEGTKWIEELIKWNAGGIKLIFALENWLTEHPSILPKEKVRIIEPFEMEKISGLSNPTPVLALVNIPSGNSNMLLEKGQWNLVLDGIQDPGNMGSIIRLADWFGLQNIWCSPESADCYNPKVVQATMGSLCRVRVHYGELETLFQKTDLPVFAAGMKGKSLYENTAKQGILVIGNEGKGVSETIKSKTTEWLTIPRIGQAESLNAAVATGILLSHLIPASK